MKPDAYRQTNRRPRLARAGVLALALFTAVGMTGGVADAAKKKKKRASVFQQQVNPNLPVPDEVAAGPSPPLNTTITVGKAFKGRVVGDVNITGIRTTGSAASAADDIRFALTSPSGRTMRTDNSIGDVSIGPLTIDDDTATSICDSATLNCSFPNQTLLRPFAGTSNLLFFAMRGTGPLNTFDGTRMKGTWTFTIWDEASPGETSVLNSWGLKITPAKPIK